MKVEKGTFLTLRDKGIYLYDPSRLGTFISCPLAYAYRHELGLIPITEAPAYGRDYGACGHAALQAWEMNNRDDKLALQTWHQKFAPLEEPPQFSSKTGKELKGTYTLLAGASLLTAYFNKYRNDQRKVVEVELCLAEEIAPNKFVCGRIDKLMQTHNGYCYGDYKFTKFPNNYDTLPSLQFQTYEYLIGKVTGSDKISGELDLLQVMKSYNGQDPITRVPFSYSDFHREEWRMSAVWWISRIDACRAANYWPQGWNCKPFFSDCAYKPLCQAPSESVRRGLIDSMYRVEYWDPFDAV